METPLLLVIGPSPSPALPLLSPNELPVLTGLGTEWMLSFSSFLLAALSFSFAFSLLFRS